MGGAPAVVLIGLHIFVPDARTKQFRRSIGAGRD